MRHELIPVARVVKPHGVRGALKVLPLDPASHTLLDVERVAIDPDGPNPRWHRVEGCRAHDAGFVVELEGIADRDAAEALRGHLLGVEREAIALDDDEYLVADLVGCRAERADGTELGEVAEVLPMPAQPVLVIRTATGELLVPLVEAFVLEVDLESRRLVVDPPEEA